MVRSASFLSTSSRRMRSEKRSRPTFGAPTASRSEGIGGGNAGRERANEFASDFWVVCQLSRVNWRATSFSKAMFLTRTEPRRVGGRERGKRIVSRYTFALVVGSGEGTGEEWVGLISMENGSDIFGNGESHIIRSPFPCPPPRHRQHEGGPFCIRTITSSSLAQWLGRCG